MTSVFVLKEIDDLVRGTELLQQEVDELRRRVAKQQDDYRSLQQQHEKDLEEMRAAGHQALALIVEEYKVLISKDTLIESSFMITCTCFVHRSYFLQELSKSAVLQQQQACEEQVVLAIEQEREKCSSLIKKQVSNHTVLTNLVMNIVGVARIKCAF